jgi:hypothetical protein
VQEGGCTGSGREQTLGRRRARADDVPWVFGGAHDAQTSTGCVVVVTVMVR